MEQADAPGRIVKNVTAKVLGITFFLILLPVPNGGKLTTSTTKIAGAIGNIAGIVTNTCLARLAREEHRGTHWTTPGERSISYK
jgi:hypothetical protein